MGTLIGSMRGLYLILIQQQHVSHPAVSCNPRCRAETPEPAERTELAPKIAEEDDILGIATLPSARFTQDKRGFEGQIACRRGPDP